MPNRSLLTIPTIEVGMNRYDELLRKEEQLNIIIRLISGGLTISEEELNVIACMEDDGK